MSKKNDIESSKVELINKFRALNYELDITRNAIFNVLTILNNKNNDWTLPNTEIEKKLFSSFSEFGNSLNDVVNSFNFQFKNIDNNKESGVNKNEN